MSPLADLQASVRRAVIDGDSSPVASLLRGGADPTQRLAIHHRHYTTSLITALVERFPATVWLVGSPLVTDAARAYVQTHPPTRPCIAEYGEDFPAFLAMQPGAANVPYLGQFVTLEWHLSRLALAVEGPAVMDVSALDATRLTQVRLVLQRSVHYLHLASGLDGLIALYLTDREPERYTLDLNETWLELRGDRGTLQMNRLTRAEFAFRSALHAGAPVGDAAVDALDVDPTFDAGQALVGLLSTGLVTALADPADIRSIQ